MKVVEKFISINGEGEKAGELAVFVRFQGCNLACNYCDTMWANEPDCPYTEESPEEIAAWVRGTGVKNVTLTGGEPLLQEEIGRLIVLLSGDGLRVEIETNGAVDLTPFTQLKAPDGSTVRPVFTMDWKVPGSGMEDAMLPGNFGLLSADDAVKFVCSSREDLERAAELTEKHGLLSRCHVHLSPVFGRIDPQEIVAFMTERKLNGVRLQIQIHKVIWDPDRRGV